MCKEGRGGIQETGEAGDSIGNVMPETVRGLAKERDGEDRRGVTREIL